MQKNEKGPLQFIIWYGQSFLQKPCIDLSTMKV